MKTFEPLLKDLPIEYALEHLELFANEPRSKAWGSPVFFFPPNYTLNQTGTGGYYYQKGYNYYDKKGRKGNCTYWCGVRYYWVSGIILTAVINSAWKVFRGYDGRKDGGNFNHEYLGDKIQKGDMVIFTDHIYESDKDDGHIVFVEDDVGDEYTFSESAYSDNKAYNGKACIVYKVKKKDLITGNYLSLRPTSPYSEVVYGVIHTGDIFDKWEAPQPTEKDNNKNQIYFSGTTLNVRDEASTSSRLMGSIGTGYYNVLSLEKKQDYTWYHLGNDSWVAGVKQVSYYPKSTEKDYKKLYEEAQNKLDRIKEIVK